MRLVAFIGCLLRDIWNDSSSVMSRKLRWMMVGLGLVFAWFSLPHVVMPLLAEMSFTPSVATVIHAGWACSDGETRMRWCTKTEADARRAAKSELRTTYFVSFSYAGSDGRPLSARWPIASTGLREREAVPGLSFGILVDPADPRRVSMRFGGDVRNTLIAVGSLFSVFLGVSWWVAAYRRRRREAAQAFAIPAGPVFTPEGQRIRPLAEVPAFGKRAPSR